MSIHLFGIRHHGPGSARSLRRALDELQPDIVLVEGPPDADGVLPLLSHGEMDPPVAILVYDPEKPERAVYYPFAAYSPEWQAIAYAQKTKIPVRFMDLPQYHRLAVAAAEEEAMRKAAEEAMKVLTEPQPEPDASVEPASPLTQEEAATDAAPGEEATAVPEGPSPEELLFNDPLQAIAEAAGYADGETWWEQVIEQRQDAADQFIAIQEMMTTLREASPLPTPESEQQREAFMRQTIRQAEKDGFQKIAVVCGAWHTPALAEMPPARDDAETLKGLPKLKTTATWIPWTYSRLTAVSGYGAGVRSPAWYEHLWHYPEKVIEQWMARAAQTLREEDLPASTASVIEAVRLANALAAVRERSLPGLVELMEAAQSVFCFGSDLPMRLVQSRLVVGEKLGKVPDETPQVPLQKDFEQTRTRLRIEQTGHYGKKVRVTKRDGSSEWEEKPAALNLREDLDKKRSNLLHRATLLGIPWGKTIEVGGKGTFKEGWEFEWQPEFAIQLIQANVWGNSVEKAASNKVRNTIQNVGDLAALTNLAIPVINADLPDVLDDLTQRIQNVAAVTSDVAHLIKALPDMAYVARYGHNFVVKVDVASFRRVAEGLLTRIVVGLPAACSSLDDKAAVEMYGYIQQTQDSVRLLDSPEYGQEWNEVLQKLVDQSGLHGLVAGRACRLLLDGGVFDTDEVGRRLNLALSLANDPPQAAAWVEGLLKGSGEILLHTDALFGLIDRWVASLDPDMFTQLLPLLRRTFSSFPQPLRKQMGERVKSNAPVAARSSAGGRRAMEIDRERAERVLPIALKLLGLESAAPAVAAS